MAKNKNTTGDLIAGNDKVQELKDQLNSIESFDGADADVSVPDGEGVQIPPKNVEVEDAEIINTDEPEMDEPEMDEEPEEPEEPEKTTMSREELIAAGILPKETKHPNQRKPIADAVHEQVTGQPAQPQMAKQVDEEYQQQIHQHCSQQGSIALEIIKAMVSNGTVSMKTSPDKLVKRAYDITDELQAVLDKRHKDALMEAFAQLNS